jgi:DNA polymerase I-like protein with 3'-5' exonuclease and polymerase domains
MRFDKEGMFWNELPKVKVGRAFVERPLPPIPDTDWQMPEGPDAFPDLSNHGMIGIDCETKDPHLQEQGPGFQRGDAYICGVSVATEAGYKAYYPVAHELGPNLPKKIVFDWLREQLVHRDQPKVGANLLYDLEALHSEGIQVQGPLYDVQIAEPLIDETRLSYALEVISQYHLRKGKTQSIMLKWLKDAFGDSETNIKKHIWRAPPSIVGPYAEDDADLPLKIFPIQRRIMESEGTWDLFDKIERRLLPMLLAMRIRGVPIDTDHAERLLSELEESFKDTIARIKDASGIAVEVWSADSLAKLFDTLGIKYPKTEVRISEKTGKTTGGAPSFRKEWLLAHPHPVAQLVNHARHMDKFKGTFVQGYLIDGSVKGRIHGQFHPLRGEQGGTISGRFSSSNPNLQNIPARTKEGTLVRQAFLPDRGRTWWKFDWSQIEYRMIVHYAFVTGQPGIEPIIERYRTDASTDYHQAIADLTGLPRQDAKNLNFGLAYGQGVDLLSYNLGVDRAEAERIMDEYHKRAPFIRPLSQLCGIRADKNGFIKTILNRRRRFQVWEHRRGKEMEYAAESNRGLFAYLLDTEQLLRNGFRTRHDPPNEFLKEIECSPENEQYLRLLKTHGWRRAFLHKVLNALIQGGAADVMKKAMVDSWEAGIYDEINVPFLTVHDELDGDMEDGNPRHEGALKELHYIMEHCIEFSVPLLAEGKRGINWGALQ